MPVWMDARGDRGEGARERERERERDKEERKEGKKGREREKETHGAPEFNHLAGSYGTRCWVLVHRGTSLASSCGSDIECAPGPWQMQHLM